MKQYINAWLSLRAMKLLEDKMSGFPSDVQKYIDRFLGYINAYPSTFVRGAWFPDSVISDNLQGGHTWKYEFSDNGIASDKTLMTGFVTHTSYQSYFPWRTAGDKPDDEKEFGGTANNGSVVISADGMVTIVLINHRCDDLDKNDSKITFFNTTVVLTPDNDGTYKVQ
jgi:hypothetical protein